MEELSIIKGVNDQNFTFRTMDRDSISVLETGYVITPDGHAVNVEDKENHSVVFSNYYNTYTESSDKEAYDLFNVALKLTQLNHVCYLGIKTSNGENIDGLGVFLLPENLESLTDAQSEMMKLLIDSNKSQYGYSEKFDLKFQKLGDGKEISREEIMAFLSKSRKK